MKRGQVPWAEALSSLGHRPESGGPNVGEDDGSPFFALLRCGPL